MTESHVIEIREKKQMNKVSFEEYVRRALNHARFYENEDASWTVEVPVLPGCISWGVARAEALEMIKDAIEAWIITALRFGDKIPAIDECDILRQGRKYLVIKNGFRNHIRYYCYGRAHRSRFLPIHKRSAV
jgi:predicted RNase H-like HicB family nuclease